MGLFDKFFKKITVSTTILKKSTEELKKEYEDMQHTFAPIQLNRQRYGIAPEEIKFLEYASGHATDLSTFAKSFYYDYGLDYEKTINFLLLNGFLRYGTASESLKLYNIQYLKEYLKKINQPVSGNKNTLIERIIESSTNFEEFFPKKCYTLTDKGISIIEQFKIDNNIPRTEQEELIDNSKYYNEQSHIHLQKGELGLYACDLYSISEIARKEKDYEHQMHSLILSAYIHLSGIDTLEAYSYWKDGDFSITKPDPLLPPAVIRSTKTCIKRLNMSIEQYRKLYLDIITSTLTPVHVFGINKTLDIICLYLEDNNTKADNLVSNGTKKFIEEFSLKRQK